MPSPFYTFCEGLDFGFLGSIDVVQCTTALKWIVAVILIIVCLLIIWGILYIVQWCYKWELMATSIKSNKANYDRTLNDAEGKIQDAIFAIEENINNMRLCDLKNIVLTVKTFSKTHGVKKNMVKEVLQRFLETHFSKHPELFLAICVGIDSMVDEELFNASKIRATYQDNGPNEYYLFEFNNFTPLLVDVKAKIFDHVSVLDIAIKNRVDPFQYIFSPWFASYYVYYRRKMAQRYVSSRVYNAITRSIKGSGYEYMLNQKNMFNMLEGLMATNKLELTQKQKVMVQDRGDLEIPMETINSSVQVDNAMHSTTSDFVAYVGYCASAIYVYQYNGEELTQQEKQNIKEKNESALFNFTQIVSIMDGDHEEIIINNNKKKV